MRQKVFGNGGSVTTVETDYVGPFHYEDADGDGSGATTAIQFFAHEEGRVRRAGNELVYEWFLKDHLGNVQVMFADMDGNGAVSPDPVNGEVLQVDHYYPFGLRMAGLSLVPGVKNSYLFTGKETQDELSLGWIDFGARMYDAAAGRWNGVDALGEEYVAISSYVFVANNPLNHVEIDGQFFVVDDWLIGGIKGLFNGEGFRASAQRHARNSIEIWKSFGATDVVRSSRFRTLQVLSRFSWELPQQVTGVFIAHFANLTIGVNEVENLHNGTIHVETKLGRKGEGWDFTLGNIITTNDFSNYEKAGSSRRLKTKPSQILNHGLGHYLQSRRWGPFYAVIVVASPSASILGLVTQKNPREYYWPENNAERLEWEYNEKRSQGTEVLKRINSQNPKLDFNPQEEMKKRFYQNPKQNED
ncbi:MAG: RHS repeat-associated core domain-containing protein [Bacteroidia bacterium]|nr:RHS repeat-associated core domain-containing protein [Bacteroidia bacterium]